MKMSDVFEHNPELDICDKGHIYCRYNEFGTEHVDFIEMAINNHDALVKALKAMTYDYAMIAGYGSEVPERFMNESKDFAGPTKIELISNAMKLLSKLEGE